MHVRQNSNFEPTTIFVLPSTPRTMWSLSLSSQLSVPESVKGCRPQSGKWLTLYRDMLSKLFRNKVVAVCRMLGRSGGLIAQKDDNDGKCWVFRCLQLSLYETPRKVDSIYVPLTSELQSTSGVAGDPVTLS